MPKVPLGFAGVGWIGRHRMKAILATGLAEAVAIFDPNDKEAGEALALAPQASRVGSIEDMLASGIEAVVIATPSALHAEQTMKCLAAGRPVFCQKPCGRNATEVCRVLELAAQKDVHLAIDYSYRHVAGLVAMRERIREGALGRVFAASLVFHNAYGPDKPWFYDRRLAGGGCLTDLGVHLIDLACWLFGEESWRVASSVVLNQGRPIDLSEPDVEDYAAAHLVSPIGINVDLACSWRLHAGQDAEISVAVYGTHGGVKLRNVDGSFYDFVTEAFTGTCRDRLSEPPDEWGGGAAQAWTRDLARGAKGHDRAEAARQLAEASLLDDIYAAAARQNPMLPL